VGPDSPNFVEGKIGPDGGVVWGPDSLGLAVPEGQLSEEVNIKIRRVPKTEVNTGGLVVAGESVYLIQAEERYLAESGEAPFTVLLPTPNDLESSALSAGVNESTQNNQRMDSTEGVAWVREVTISPEDKEWMALAERELDSKSRMYVPINEVPVTLTDTEQSKTSVQPLMQPAAHESSGGFRVECWPSTFEGVAVGVPLASNPCKKLKDREVPKQIESELKIAQHALESEGGFEKPFLDQVSKPILEGDIDRPLLSGSPTTYEINVVGKQGRAVERETKGNYAPESANIEVVAKKGGRLRDTGDILKISRHELTHAYQYNQLGKPGNEAFLRSLWIIEGGATLAELTTSTLDATIERDRDIYRRPLEPPLASEEESIEYKTQDFWAFVHESSEFQVEYSATRKVMDEMRSGGRIGEKNYDEVEDAIGNLDEIYWEWAKYRAYEGGRNECQSYSGGGEGENINLATDHGRRVNINLYNGSNQPPTLKYGSEWASIKISAIKPGIEFVSFRLHTSTASGETNGLRAKAFRITDDACFSNAYSGLDQDIKQLELNNLDQFNFDFLISNTSDRSYEISLGITVRPSAPTNLKADTGDEEVVLNWDSSDEGLNNRPDECEIYRSDSPFEDADEAEMVGRAGSVNAAKCHEQPSFTDSDVEEGTTYYYRVSGTYLEGGAPSNRIESRLSEMVEVKILPGPPGRPE
jgi:hypothetical protein